MTRLVWNSQLLTFDAQLREAPRRIGVGDPIIPYYCNPSVIPLLLCRKATFYPVAEPPLQHKAVNVAETVGKRREGAASTDALESCSESRSGC
jgi:hypothetical protein